MKKNEMVELILENLELKLIKERLKVICPLGDVSKLSKIELQRLVDIIIFEKSF
jgi:hypothetical protein